MLAYGKSSMELQDITLKYNLEKAQENQEKEQKDKNELDLTT